MADTVLCRSTVTKGLDTATAEMAVHQVALADLVKQRETFETQIADERDTITMLQRRLDQLNNTLVVLDAVDAAPVAAPVAGFSTKV